MRDAHTNINRSLILKARLLGAMAEFCEAGWENVKERNAAKRRAIKRTSKPAPTAAPSSTEEIPR